MPFCYQRIVAVRCLHPHRWKCTQAAAAEPKTIGEHIKKRRLHLHLMQSDLAKLFGVHKCSVQNWERGIHAPVAGLIPRIIGWLGYEPNDIGTRGGKSATCPTGGLREYSGPGYCMADEDSNRPPEIRDPGGDAQGSPGEQSPLQARAAFLANWDWESVVRLNRGVCERGRAQHGTNSESVATVRDEWQQRREVEASLGETLDYLRTCQATVLERCAVQAVASLSDCSRTVELSGNPMGRARNSPAFPRACCVNAFENDSGLGPLARRHSSMTI